MSTSPINNSPVTSAFASAEARIPQAAMGQDEFLELLVTQMTHQDPLAPKGDMEFISQMASFTSLEQTRAMVADLAEMRDDQAVLKANALIGRTVQLHPEQGIGLRGVVTDVYMEAGKPQVVVNGQLYDLDQVNMISSPGMPAPNPPKP